MLYSICSYGLLILTIILPSYIIPAGNWLSDTELMSFTENLLQQEPSDLSNHVITWEQGKTAPSCLADHAPQPLLWLDKKVFSDYPTITSLVKLYDKYYPDDSHHERPYFHEDEDDDEEEESNFLDSVLETNIMNFTQSFLIDKRIFIGSKNKFKKLLKRIWFTYYRRDTAKQISSAFEHVFLGEINKDGSVLGLHNWLFFYREEALHNLNYLGWIQKIYFGKGSLLKLHYVWLGHNKPVSTMFVGTTPEFELALYTVCFLARANDRCYFSLAGNTVYIKTYMFNSNGNAYMGSSYPGI